jgi:hypothetical protein
VFYSRSSSCSHVPFLPPGRGVLVSLVSAWCLSVPVSTLLSPSAAGFPLRLPPFLRVTGHPLWLPRSHTFHHLEGIRDSSLQLQPWLGFCLCAKPGSQVYVRQLYLLVAAAHFSARHSGVSGLGFVQLATCNLCMGTRRVSVGVPACLVCCLVPVCWQLVCTVVHRQAPWNWGVGVWEVLSRCECFAVVLLLERPTAWAWFLLDQLHQDTPGPYCIPAQTRCITCRRRHPHPASLSACSLCRALRSNSSWTQQLVVVLSVCRVPLIQQVLYPSAASPVQSPHLSWQVPLLGWCAV